jgi:hypothetical protein
MFRAFTTYLPIVAWQHRAQTALSKVAQYLNHEQVFSCSVWTCIVHLHSAPQALIAGFADTMCDVFRVSSAMHVLYKDHIRTREVCHTGKWARVSVNCFLSAQSENQTNAPEEIQWADDARKPVWPHVYPCSSYTIPFPSALQDVGETEAKRRRRD